MDFIRTPDMSEPVQKRPLLCSSCNMISAWRDSVREIFIVGLNGQAALPMSIVFGIFLVMLLLQDGSSRERVLLRFMESPLFAWGGWFACIVFALAYIFCYKVTMASKDAQIKMLEEAKTPRVARQMELALAASPAKNK